jgi:transglutaminase-like putative cysteine protease
VPERRPALLALVPGLLIAASWLRLEEPRRDAGRALVLVLLAVSPALARGLRRRLALLAAVTLAAVDLSARAPALHPWSAASRLGDGLRDFYGVRLPFGPALHPGMHSLLLLAAFGFTAGVALAAAARRPLVAVLVLVVGAAWPATLLTGDRDLARGAAILAASLLLLAGLRDGGSPALGRAALVGSGIVAAAFVAATEPAVAKSELLHWQTWDPYARQSPRVGVRFVWDAGYDGITWPRKTTTVLRVQASGRSLYWRAATLDVFTGTRWIEARTPAAAVLVGGRLDVAQRDPLAPAAARDRARWQRAEVEVVGLADDHVVAPSVPVAYGSGLAGIGLWQGGTATVASGLARGDRYEVWSFSPDPTPRQLAAATPDYPPAASRYLEVRPGLNAPPAFGTPGRDEAVRRFLSVYPDYRGLYDTALRVAGRATSPYGAALALESWLRSTGGFTYTTRPPRSGPEPLLDFVLRTKRGYCQHFAGAMALMLRYLGIPARVAEGFVSGSYDASSGTWTVTDHDAHAWVEAWFDGYGWLPFDPTPARGRLSAPYSVSSPAFRASTARGIVGGLAGSLLRRSSLGGASVGGSAPGVSFLGTDIRPAAPSPGGAAASGLSGRGGSLGKLLAVVLGAALALLALVKAVRRHARYATADPRRRAAACRAELRDLLADQGIRLEPSAGPEELARVLGSELDVDARAFALALAEARFGPPATAGAAAARARAELARLRVQVRRRLGIVRRARGLLSLRSLGFAA